jgi:secreted trypsin-like serine protease
LKKSVLLGRFGAAMAPLWILLFIVVSNVICELNLSNSPCYKPKLFNYRRSLRIVGGFDSELGETPYMVACMKNGVVVCGASIVSERFLVLAAHCVCNNQNSVIRPTQLKIYIGARRITDTLVVDGNHLDDDKTAINEVFIDKIIVHQEYSCGRNKENDIGERF